MIEIAYQTISYGSSGEDVKKLQESLNEKGYSLTVDGIFGSKTRAAVEDYQRKNGLNVDGIVGSKTWGSINSKSTTTTTTTASKPATSTAAGGNSSTRPEYEKSQAVKDAEAEIEDWEKNKPGAYESKYDDEIDRLVEDILSREDFRYDMQSDPLYQQYRQMYMENGQKAMRDTVGQAAALTGGYANSYAVTAGNQAYADYLDELNGIALDLRDRAYEIYVDEGEKLIADITILRDLEGDEYEKYLNTLEQYYADGDYLFKKLVEMSDAEFEAFVAQVEAWESDRDYEFKKYQDDLDRQEFEAEMAFKESEAARDQANKDRAAAQKSSGSGSSSSSSKKTKSTNEYTVYPETYKQYVAMTGNGRIYTEEMFMKDENAKKKYGTYKNYLKVMYDKYA
ncbi:MAG: peptidoglycan-binding protein [Clostridia bacterium]|nr:peptidoglycan-binding protein [Clostridia bacterium]